MNREELIEYMAKRKPSPHAEKFDDLVCNGCAHSAASAPPPGKPSGERPCCSCVRNPERDKWAAEAEERRTDAIVMGSDGHARCFDPFAGTTYNGAPTPHFPADNYVTLDHHDRVRFMESYPEYDQPIRFVDGVPTPVTGE